MLHAQKVEYLVPSQFDGKPLVPHVTSEGTFIDYTTEDKLYARILTIGNRIIIVNMKYVKEKR